MISVEKPLELASLKSLLIRLFNLMQSQFKKNAARNIQTNQASTDVAQPLTNTLFNLLLDTKLSQKVIELQFIDDLKIFVDGINHSLATNANDQQLRVLAEKDPSEVTISQLEPDNFAVHTNDLCILSLYNFLWLSGIACSRGRLLEGHTMDQAFKLRAWPNFTRHDFKPDYFKLAALLAKGAYSINELQEVSQISKHEIINFYNAAYAVDILDRGEIEQYRSHTPRKTDEKKQGLFSKIAQRLTLRSQR